MIEVSIDRADLRRWFICESQQRWIGAVRRFAPELMPRPLVPEIIPVAAAELVPQLATGHGHSVIVIWESAHGSLLPVCDGIIAAADACPAALQIVAAPNRTDRERAILLELPCAAILRNPEDLMSLGSMIRTYFQPPTGI